MKQSKKCITIIISKTTAISKTHGKEFIISLKTKESELLKIILNNKGILLNNPKDISNNFNSL